MLAQTRDEILLRVQTAQNLCSEDPERAELFLRDALNDADALGQSSPTLHLSWRSSSVVSEGRASRSRKSSRCWSSIPSISWR